MRDGKNTPLHLAAQYGHTATVDTLIQGRADVNAVDVVRAGMSGLFSAGRLICFFVWDFFCVCVCLFTYMNIYMYMIYMNIVHICISHTYTDMYFPQP